MIGIENLIICRLNSPTLSTDWVFVYFFALQKCINYYSQYSYIFRSRLHYYYFFLRPFLLKVILIITFIIYTTTTLPSVSVMFRMSSSSTLYFLLSSYKLKFQWESHHHQWTAPKHFGNATSLVIFLALSLIFFQWYLIFTCYFFSLYVPSVLLVLHFLSVYVLYSLYISCVL